MRLKTLFDWEQEIFYMHHPINRIIHNIVFVIPVVEHWLEIEKTTIKDKLEENHGVVIRKGGNIGIAHKKVKVHIDSEIGNLLSQLCQLLFRMTTKDLLYAPSHRQDNTYHDFRNTIVI